jgi:hypothetical protein
MRFARRPLGTIAAAVAALLGLAAGAAAQAPASVSGRLAAVDGRGPVAGAVVRLVGDGGASEVTLETDERGRFGCLGVRPGRYRVTIEREGFAPVDVVGVDVRSSDSVRLHVELTPFDEAPFKRQTLRYRRPLINTENATLGTRIL